MSEKIVSIRYRKSTGEYQIKTKNERTGDSKVIHANHLTEAEKSWAREHSRSRYETPYEISWC